MKQTIFSPNSKMADVIHLNYNNLMLLERMNIKLGFGDKTIAEVCEKHNVDSTLFIVICSIFSNHEYEPSESDLLNISIDQLLSFLKKSHNYYRKVRLKEVKNALTDLVKTCDASLEKALVRFYDEYFSEVEKHLLYEDQKVFPYIENLLKNVSEPGYNIHVFEDNHDDVEMKLTDLKNIIIKYLPEAENDDLRRVLLEKLFIFEEDLNRHILIEDKVLIPIVAYYENKAK